MIDPDDIELRLATTLAPMLLTVGTFSLGAMTLVQAPDQTILDELLAILSAFSVFAAAILADCALDKLSLKFPERLTFLGGGYLAFCVVVSFMTAIIPILYETHRHPLTQGGWRAVYVPGCLAGIFSFLKLMTWQDKQAWTIGLLFSYAATFFVLCQFRSQ